MKYFLLLFLLVGCCKDRPTTPGDMARDWANTLQLKNAVVSSCWCEGCGCYCEIAFDQGNYRGIETLQCTATEGCRRAN